MTVQKVGAASHLTDKFFINVSLYCPSHSSPVTPPASAPPRLRVKDVTGGCLFNESSLEGVMKSTPPPLTTRLISSRDTRQQRCCLLFSARRLPAAGGPILWVDARLQLCVNYRFSVHLKECRCLGVLSLLPDHTGTSAFSAERMGARPRCRSQWLWVFLFCFCIVAVFTEVNMDATRVHRIE